jgi:uncharacterized membrane protein
MLTDFMGFMFLLEQFHFHLYRLNKVNYGLIVGFELASLYFHWVDFIFLVFIIVYSLEAAHETHKDTDNFLFVTAMTSCTPSD